MIMKTHITSYPNTIIVMTHHENMTMNKQLHASSTLWCVNKQLHASSTLWRVNKQLHASSTLWCVNKQLHASSTLWRVNKQLHASSTLWRVNKQLHASSTLWRVNKQLHASSTLWRVNKQLHASSTLWRVSCVWWLRLMYIVARWSLGPVACSRSTQWLAVHYEEARGWVILNNALAPLVHYSESPTRVPLQIPIMHS